MATSDADGTPATPIEVSSAVGHGTTFAMRVPLDVDHDPKQLLDPTNAAFYTPEGLTRAKRWLHPGGVLATYEIDGRQAELYISDLGSEAAADDALIDITTDTKKTFCPIPGARAIGCRAQRPINRQPNAAERQVAAMTADVGIPAAERMAGLTKTM